MVTRNRSFISSNEMRSEGTQENFPTCASLVLDRLIERVSKSESFRPPRRAG
jgi:hypothetical protein